MGMFADEKTGFFRFHYYEDGHMAGINGPKLRPAAIRGGPFESKEGKWQNTETSARKESRTCK